MKWYLNFFKSSKTNKNLNVSGDPNKKYIGDSSNGDCLYEDDNGIQYHLKGNVIHYKEHCESINKRFVGWKTKEIDLENLI